MIQRGFTTAGTGEKLTPFPSCGGGGTGTDTDDQPAAEVPYDNSGSGLTADDVQEAIDELAAQVAACCDSMAGGGISSGELLSTGEVEEISSTAGTSAALAAEILADSPRGYWKLNDASGNPVDSSGNGYTLTASGTPQYNHSPLLSNDNEKYLRFGSGTTRLTLNSSMGVTTPLTGDWTVGAIVVAESINVTKMFQFGGSVASETEADNIQVRCELNLANGAPEVLWERGAGTNEIVTCNYTPDRVGEPVFYHFKKNGTANTITLYRNGKQLGAPVAYTNEPTGGSGTMTINIGYDGTFNTITMILGHVFYIDSGISADRIYAHARAAGLTGG